MIAQMAAVLAALLLAGGARAEADGPDFYRVVGVSADDVLNIRAAPTVRAAIVGTIPAGADGVRNFGSTGGMTLAAFQAATPEERAAARRRLWRRVGYDRVIGWSAGRYLVEGAGPDAFDGGDPLPRLAGSEWGLRDVAGEAVALEAWVAFREDGVHGRGGCNRFTGSYEQNFARLEFGPVGATMMACEPAKMDLDTRLFAAFEATREVVATHLVMALFDADNRLLATFQRRDFD